jgi:molybdate transport repressor ModE-like protein
MHNIAIKPVWTIQNTQGQSLSPRLIELLASVQRTGSLQAACQALDMSYRHGWDLVRQAEALFGAPLLLMARGKGSRLTPLGEKLVWADHRIAARLNPILDTLASELSAEIGRALAHPAPPLRIHASHGFSIEKLIDALTRSGHAVERRYGSSIAAVAALHDGQCDVCGLHIPTGPLQAQALAHYAQWLKGDDWCVIDIATRRQGLMVAPGNPKKIYDLHDLLRDDVHFINRPIDSGTRHLLHLMLASERIDERGIKGFEQSESTHSAVATCVASGMADVGFGLETPARQFGLDFIPLAKERYFLVCRTATLAQPAVQALVDILRSPAFQQDVNALPGYDPRHAGTVTPLDQAFANAGDAP